MNGTNQFPPVQPEHCADGTNGTNACIYTMAGDASIPSLTTGEMQRLIENTVTGTSPVVPYTNLAIQNEGLLANKPDYNTNIDPDYGSIQIPCGMNALLHTAIGYQSAGTTFMSGADKLSYLESLMNGPAYGAQYLELFPKELNAFVLDTNASDAITFNGISNYGTTQMQNIDMLATTLKAALSVMTANRANSASSTLCHLPVIISTLGTQTVPFTYYP